MIQVFSLWRGTMLVSHQYRPAPTTRKADITREICERYDVTVDKLKGPCRTRDIAWPRQEAYWRCRQAGHSLLSIGAWFGRDHTTVMYGCRAHEARLTKAEQRA